MDKTIVGCSHDDVAEIRSLGRTLGRWRTEILNHHHTGASNGRTEAHNLIVEKLRRLGHGYRNLANYRLRLLLHTGVKWHTPPTVKLRGRTHRSPMIA